MKLRSPRVAVAAAALGAGVLTLSLTLHAAPSAPASPHALSRQQVAMMGDITAVFEDGVTKPKHDYT